MPLDQFKTFSVRLKIVLKELNMKPEELKQLVNISQSTYYKYTSLKKSNYFISEQGLLKLKKAVAKKLGVNAAKQVEDFLSGDSDVFNGKKYPDARKHSDNLGLRLGRDKYVEKTISLN